MLVVNLFGGPCTGKSTLAASLFAALKMRGYNVELVTEFAKDLVWTERTKELEDQVYILGKMYHKLWRLKDKVAVAIVDSPLLLCTCYDKGRTKNFNEFVLGLHYSFNNYNILLQQNFKYQKIGRYQDEETAKQQHLEICTMLNEYDIYYHTKSVPVNTGGETQGEYNSFVQSLIDNFEWLILQENEMLSEKFIDIHEEIY